MFHTSFFRCLSTYLLVFFLCILSEWMLLRCFFCLEISGWMLFRCFCVFFTFKISFIKKNCSDNLNYYTTPDPTHLNLHNQFITFIDMRLHVQNQFCTSFSFWDLKVLIASLGMTDHAWPRPSKTTSSIFSVNWDVSAWKNSTLYL